MTTEEALIRACAENPDEHDPLLRLADYLQEQGEVDRVFLIRFVAENVWIDFSSNGGGLFMDDEAWGLCQPENYSGNPVVKCWRLPSLYPEEGLPKWGWEVGRKMGWTDSKESCYQESLTHLLTHGGTDIEPLSNFL